MIKSTKLTLHGGGGSGGGCFECTRGGGGNKKRLLIIVNVLGSAGPLRFVVKEDDNVGNVINTALKLYAKQGRLPHLMSSSPNHDFFLYSSNSASNNAMSEWEAIGTSGARNFVLCKKPTRPKQRDNMREEARSDLISRNNKKINNWKTWLTKSCSFKIISH